MTIRAVNVVRDECGMWTHPGIDLAGFGECITEQDFEKFQTDNNFTIEFVFMDTDAEQEFIDEWFEYGACDCTPWEPTPPAKNAFLLSIHDTEDGPVAWFAIPNEK